MGAVIENTRQLLESHLSGNVPDLEHFPFVLANSPLSGRGLLASRDISAGELIFIDIPLAVGPKLCTAPLCLGCHELKTLGELKTCSRCNLPVCSTDCELSGYHIIECQLLSKHEGKRNLDWKKGKPIFQIITPLRCLALADSDVTRWRVLRCLESNVDERRNKPIYEATQKLVVEVVRNELGLAQFSEDTLHSVCGVLDTNAFELDCGKIRLRGLYPLSAMMNHTCTPNTTHYFDQHHRMIVKASVPIVSGSEITTTYTSVLWGTVARRHHLQLTKHFLCTCWRCCDPTEGGAALNALRCTKCTGNLLPADPLHNDSNWQCTNCAFTLPAKQVSFVQNTLGRIVKSLDSNDVAKIRTFTKRYRDVIPEWNQIMVEFKYSIVQQLGNHERCKWIDLSDEDILYKINLCRELLQLLEILQAGQCRMKGLLLYELHVSLMEQISRHLPKIKTSQDLREEAKQLLQSAESSIQEAARILSGDRNAPADICWRLNATKKLSETLHHNATENEFKIYTRES